MIKSNEISIQHATLNDGPTLVSHHNKMFEEIWESRGLEINDQKMKDMDKAYVQKLHKEIGNGECLAWVIKNDDKTVASGAVSFVSMVSTPDDPSAMSHCKSKGLKRMILNASEVGRPIYEDIGFHLSDNSMRLLIQ